MFSPRLLYALLAGGLAISNPHVETTRATAAESPASAEIIDEIERFQHYVDALPTLVLERFDPPAPTSDAHSIASAPRGAVVKHAITRFVFYESTVAE